jgi:hypothetical protein
VRYTFEEYALEELTFLGITSSTAFEREPEGNGCVARRGYQGPAAGKARQLAPLPAAA